MAPLALTTEVLSAVMRGDKKKHPPGNGSAIGLRNRKPSNYLDTRTTNFSILLRDAYVGDNGTFVLALFLSALFTGLVTLLSQASRRAEYSVLARRPRPALKARAAAAFVHGVRMFMFYIAVLVAMTNNLWLIFALAIGHMLGWLMFSTLATSPVRGNGEGEAQVVEGIFDEEIEDAIKKKNGDIA